MVTLSQVHKEQISHFLKLYMNRLRNELQDGNWQKDRKERTKYYQKVFSKEHLDKLTEAEFGKAVKKLWASLIWGNKEYLVNKILTDNGIENIRNALKILLYGEESLQERFDIFSNSIKGLGTSSITEIMSFVNPREYAIWNDKPKNVLPLFKIEDILPEKVFKYQLNGKDYALCNDVLKQVGKEMEDQGLKAVDMLDVDILMWLLFLEVIKKEPKPDTKKVKKEDVEEPRPKISLEHTDAQGILLELGNLLGYDTYTPDVSKTSKYLGKQLGDIATLKEIPGFTFKDTLEVVARIDAIWFKNGEYPEHCFEVEHTTGVTSGLLRLYQISPLKGIRFFIVAPSDVLTKFEKEITRKPFKEIKKRYTFKSYDELLDFYIEAKKYHGLKTSFLG